MCVSRLSCFSILLLLGPMVLLSMKEMEEMEHRKRGLMAAGERTEELESYVSVCEEDRRKGEEEVEEELRKRVEEVRRNMELDMGLVDCREDVANITAAKG